jgi:hypothetical protein
MKQRKAVVASILVLLALLVGGLGLYQSSTQANAQGATSRYFAETGHTVNGRFLTYWNSHGGLAQFGYPLTDEFPEKSDLNGQTYTVQYFERAVMEYHPENQPPYDVLLSQLGTYRLHEKYPNGVPNPTPVSGAQIDGGLKALHMFGTQEGYAVGSGGVIYHYVNGSWQKDNSPTTNNLHGLYLSAKGQGFAVGDHGTALGFTDDNWAITALPTSADLFDVAQGDLGEWWMVGSGVIVHDMIGKFSTQTTPDNATLLSIDMLNANEGWAVGYAHPASQAVESIILHYSNSQWQRVNAPVAAVLNRVRMSDPNNGWIVGDNGVILRYTGGNWVQVVSPTNQPLLDVSINNGTGWAVGADLLRYQNGVWSKVANPLASGEFINSADILSDLPGEEGWAVGETGNASNPGVILHYLNGNWSVYGAK